MRGSSDAANPQRSNDAQEDDPLRAEKGLQQETVEPQGEVAAATVPAQA